MQRHLLTPAAALVLGAFGSQAMAATVNVDLGLPLITDVTGHLAINSVQNNADNITAEVLSGVGSIDGTADDGLNNTFTVDANVFAALATGNSFLNQIELDLIDGPDGTGAGSLGFSLNNGVIRSRVDTSGFDQTIVGIGTSSFSVSDNLVLAQTTLNSGDTEIFGSLPTGYTDDTAGSIAFEFGNGAGTDDLASTATIAAASFQLSQGGADTSSASLSGNFATFSLDAAAVTPLDVDSSLTVDNNEFAANLTGNTATTSVPILTGDNDTFTGTVAAANLQGNLLAGTATAETTTTTVSGDVGTNNVADLTRLLGTLTVSGNSVDSSATGNRASTSVSLEDGMSYQGSANTAAPGVDLLLSVAAPEVQASLDADLALLNVQGNQGSTFVSQTTATTITAGVQSLNGGTVLVDANSINSAASGNIGSSSILAGSANDFSGSVSLGSVQVNDGGPSTLGATTFNSAVRATIGGNAASLLVDASVSVADTTVGASATGNRVTNAVDLNGNTLALGEVGAGASFGSLSGGQRGEARMAIEGDASLASVQATYSTDVTASIGDTAITIVAQDLAANISASTLDVSGSTVDAVAMGSRGSNSLSLNANALSGSAGLGSAQAMDVADNAASATVADTTLSIAGGGVGIGVDDSTLNLSDNLVRGLSFGNMATNEVGITANAALIPVGAGADASVASFDFPSVNQTVDAAYGLLNVQTSISDATASVGATLFSVNVDDSLDSSTVATDRNAVVGAAFGNETLNAMALDVNNLSLAGASGAVANVTSVQGFDGNVSADVTNVPLDGMFVTTIGLDVTDSTVSVNDNLVQSQAVGNRAAANGDLGNTLSVTGTNISALPDAPLGGLSVGAAAITADTMFSVQNLQIFSNAATLTSDVVAAEFIVDLSSDLVTGSTVGMDGNNVLASGTLNQATNGVSLTDITTLESAAGLNSFQQGVGSVDITIDGSGQILTVGLGNDGNVTNSSLSISDNTQEASARANVSANSVAVAAANVTVFENPAASSVTNLITGTSTVAAAFGSLNTQTQTGNLSATVDEGFVSLFVDGDGTNSTFSTDGNVLSARAAANTTTNASDLALGNLAVAGVDGESAIGAVTSIQSLDGTVDAAVLSVGGSIQLDVGAANTGSVLNSTLSVSDNTLQAQTFGNRALDSDGLGNQLVVSGGSIDATLTGAAGLTLALGVATADLAFTVQNVQTTTVDSDLTSSVADAVLGLSVGDDVTDSTLSLNDNVLNAAASSNLAGNRLEMTGLNAINSSAGVQSGQLALGETTASAVNTDLTLPTFSIAVGGDLVSGSTLELSGNRVDVTATGNRAGNTLLAEANGILGGADIAAANSSNIGVQAAVADFAVQNAQEVQGDVTGTGDSQLSIDAGNADVRTITGSSVLLDGNVQSVAARGNVGVNVLELSATNLGDAVGTGASATLYSAQTGDAAISATATLDGEAPGSITNSSLSMSSNENRAAAVLNDVANRVSTSATNLFSSAVGTDNANAATTSAGASSASADQSLLNLQFAAETVTATATTSLANIDFAPQDTSGIIASSAVLNSNLTEASATANRSNSALELNASNLGATGALTSFQDSSSAVTTTATSTTAFALNAAGAVVTGSTIDVSGNSTIAASSGNRATNALSALATAGYNNIDAAGATGAIDTTGLGAFSSNATYGVLNSQGNAGAIGATVTGTTASIALTGGADAVTASTLSASNNQMIAEASGNFASNALTMAARPGGNGSGALTSFQSNTGGISATLAASSMSVNITGGTGVSGNTASVSGNRGIARASGNTAVNRILSGN